MKFIKGFIALYNTIMKKYDPIISKCVYDNVFAIAGQSAFFILLSSVPLAAFFVSLLQSLHISPDLIELTLTTIFAENVVDFIKGFLSETYNNTAGISFITIIITLWSAAQGIHAITNGLNRVYNAYEDRNWFLLRLRAMLYTILLFVLILGSFIVIGLGSYIDELLSPVLSYMPDIIATIFHMRFVLLFIIFTVTFALIYRNFPCISKEEHKEYKFKYQLPGALLCTVSWYVLSFGISVYVESFNGFSIYGVITGLAIVMILLYFFMMSLMICAEINYVYHDKIKSFSFRKAITSARKTILRRFSKNNASEVKK